MDISGTNGSPITFGAYGQGDLPVISGSECIQGWTKVAGTNMWSVTITGDDAGIYVSWI